MLDDKDRIFRNLYGQHDWGLEGALKRGAWDGTKGFIEKGRDWLVNEVKAETGAKGKELFHPVRLIVTGSHSGPEFDKLIPILEAGSHLNLPKHILSVRERVEEFAKARIP